MDAGISVRTVAAMKLAAIRHQVAIGGVGAAWRPALDKAGEFLWTSQGTRTDDHNVFFYHHPACRDVPLWTSELRSCARLSLKAKSMRSRPRALK